jgi:putative transposase
MPRQARVVLPNFPHHIVQRGHNKQVVFAQPQDFESYLSNLKELKATFGVKVYAFCLMTNHVHLLLDPGDDATALGKLMKSLAARTTRYRNRLEGRSGTLWESRYKSSLVQTDTYLLACSRYIELNPVRAGMTEHAREYRWSSFRLRCPESAEFNWLDESPCFKGLGADQRQRWASYASFVEHTPPAAEMQLIRTALQRGQLTGSSTFTDETEKIIGRRVSLRGPGRPWNV